MSATSAFIAVFNEQAVTSSLDNSDEFDEYSNRRLRYIMYLASYENTSYRNIHDWAQGLRVRYALGKNIKDVYNPTSQLVNFHVSSIYRGSIAPLLIGGAIPLVVSGKTDEERVRYAADTLMRQSNFEIAKNIAVMKGCNLGDVGIEVVDDTQRGQVRLEVIDPNDIEDVILENGIIKAYRLTRWQENENDLLTQYTKVVERGDNDDVIYRTYVNNKLAAFPGAEYAEWVEAYGFIPFVTIQHNNVGGKWGWAEAHPIRPKIMHMDDQATYISNWLARTSNSVGLISGIDAPSKKKVTVKTSDASDDAPEPTKEESRFIWAGKDVQAGYTPLVAPLDVASASAYIQTLMASLESDMPELRKSIWDIQGDPSGVALATAREPVEAKIIGRRPNYDSPLTRCIQMGIAIGGMRGYPGYDGFDLQSYERGQLDISIAPRPVFPEQRGEKIAATNTFWTTWAQLATSSTVPFSVYAHSYGWTDDQIADYEKRVQADLIPADGL